MTTSCLVAFVCDPYLAVFFKQLYLKYWKNEIDELLVNVNGQSRRIKNFIVDLYEHDSKVSFVDNQRMMRQGTAFNYLYPHVAKDCDVLMTMDSDNFVYEKGVVSRYVTDIKNGKTDCIGSVGNHAYPSEVLHLINAKYFAARLNPFMTFWNTKLFPKMPEVNFASFGYKKGDNYPPIGIIPADGYMEVMAKLFCDFSFVGGRHIFIPQTSAGYVHANGISQVFRRFFHDIEGNEDEAKTSGGNFIQVNYLIWRYVLHWQAKDQVPMDINNEHQRLINKAYGMLGLRTDTLEHMIEKEMRLYPGLLE
jgi:hypothetical protein